VPSFIKHTPWRENPRKMARKTGRVGEYGVGLRMPFSSGTRGAPISRFCEDIISMKTDKVAKRLP